MFGDDALTISLHTSNRCPFEEMIFGLGKFRHWMKVEGILVVQYEMALYGEHQAYGFSDISCIR